MWRTWESRCWYSNVDLWCSYDYAWLRMESGFGDKIVQAYEPVLDRDGLRNATGWSGQHELATAASKRGDCDLNWKYGHSWMEVGSVDESKFL